MKLSSIKNILKNWNNPFYVRNAIIYKIINYLNRDLNGIKIFNYSWDNLIILDACRYDLFENEWEKTNINGNLYKAKSSGSHTKSFIKNNFKKDFYNNLVYITANPHVDILLKNRIYKIISVWKSDWNEKYHTVLPEVIYQHAIDASIKFPDKKLIIHFMQPHYPYIGYNLRDKSLEYLKQAALNENKIKSDVNHKESLLTWHSSKIYRIIDKKEHYRLYKKNFLIVWSYVLKLIKNLSGKIIITSDHGEAFGEKIHPLIPIKFYGHKEGININPLRNIPWLEIEKDKKRMNKSLIERKKIIDTANKFKIDFDKKI